jgi:hypothetical protein
MPAYDPGWETLPPECPRSPDLPPLLPGEQRASAPGRGWILEQDFFGRLLPEGGDLGGVIEQRPA